jgi:ADP-heptose:LPS heptosyltransferase
MLKNLSIKILARLVLVIGNIIRRKRRLDPSRIKSILVNRADRLGDAAVSLPFLLELGKKFKITVLTSQYNDSVLKGILDTEVFTDNPLPISTVISRMLKQALCFGLSYRRNAEPKYDLYLDLVGISAIDVLLKVKANNLCRYHIGFNLGPWNLLLDYSAAKNPVLFSRIHLLDSYRLLLKNSLGLVVDIPDNLNLDKYLTRPGDFSLPDPYILINISGGNKFRGPKLQGYAKILEELNFTGRIVVMDDQGRSGLAQLKGYLKKENLYYLERDHPIWELAYIAKHSVMYIGSDSGITQLLASLTHCVIFFATGSHLVWRPYSKTAYSKKTSGRIVIEETKTSSGLIKKIIHIPVWCRPCFDIGCIGYRCMAKLDTEFVALELRRTLVEIGAL